MASDNSDSDDAFYGATDLLVQSIRESLSPELREMVGRRLLEEQSTNPADPIDTLKVLSKFLKLSAKPCSEDVKFDVGNAILDKSDPVNLFFGCLPSPESHEMCDGEDGGRAHLVDAYHHAYEVLKYFVLVQGENEVKIQYTDAVHNKLFEFLYPADGRAISSFTQWSADILRLVWEVPRGGDIRMLHTVQTQDLIEYLRWLIRGRKEVFCTVQKLWATVDQAELRARAYDDLSRLPDNTLLGNCANCSAEGAGLRCTCCCIDPKQDHGAGTAYCSHKCREADSKRHAVSRQETRELSRCTILFQIAFVQYLLSINYQVGYTVSAYDGMVKVFLGGSAPLDLTPESTYQGVSPDLNLSLPEVEAALHAFNCCAIKDPARSLLEYFFRSSSTSIEFVDFIPKNAHTQVLEHHAGVRPRFNTTPMHTVAILRTKSGLQFVLDPTAAQYGWKENISPQETYARCRIHREIKTTVCLAPRSPGPRTEHTLRPEDESELAHWTRKWVAEDVVDLVKDYFSATASLQDTLQLPQDQFEEQCLQLKEALKSGMCALDHYRASN
ncbi:hypothetical protein SLS64_014198 [Diaporthe eres]